MQKSKLFVVATPIGNYEDITLRALRVLQEADLVVCEDLKPGRRMLSKLNIKRDYNQLIPLNEHTEQENTKLIFQKMLESNIKVALISDAGTPLFADPGNKLIKKCHDFGFEVIPVPGASSLMSALMVSGLNLEKFYYYGFLPANKVKRQNELKGIEKYKHSDIIFLEAPYRLKQLVGDMKKILGGNREAILFYKLTYPQQKIYFGNLKEMAKIAENLKKGEFVFVLRGVE